MSGRMRYLGFCFSSLGKANELWRPSQEKIALLIPCLPPSCREAASSSLHILPCRVHTYFSKELGSSGTWAHNPLGIFCFCAAVTHLGSTATHVYPDSFTLVRSSPYPVYQLTCHQPKKQLPDVEKAMLWLARLKRICVKPLLGQHPVQKGPANLSRPASCWHIDAFLSVVCLVCTSLAYLLLPNAQIAQRTVSLQEKLDHLGIVALVAGTPLTALMAHEHGNVPLDVKVVFGAMLAAALLPPAWRVAGFSAGTLAAIWLHWREVMNANLAVQIALYGLSGALFLR